MDNVPLNCRLTFEFSEPVDASTIGPDSIQVRQGDAFGMTAPGTFVVEGATVYFEPRLPGLCDLSDTGFYPDTDYRVQVLGWPEHACIRNTQGQPLDATLTASFHTRDEGDPDVLVDQLPGAAPAVTSVFPADGAQAVGVAPGNQVRIEFSENLHPCSIDFNAVRFHVYEFGALLTYEEAPNQKHSGFSKGGDTADQTPNDPYTWGADGTTSLAGDPQTIPASLELEQSFQSTTLTITPLFGRFPENALIVVELTFRVEDFGHQALAPYVISFTTENLQQQTSSYLVENEGETPYLAGVTTAHVDVQGVCPSRVQGFLLFAGDGDNGTALTTPGSPEDDPPACTTLRSANDGVADHFQPTSDITLDTGAVPNLCPNAVDGSYAVVWEFASFYIAPNVTVRIIGVNPAILLVQGDATIAAGGRLLLDGADGENGNDYPSGNEQPALGGAGVAGGGDGGDSRAVLGLPIGEHGWVGYGSPDYELLPHGGIGAGHGNTAVRTDSYSLIPSSAAGGGGGHSGTGGKGDANLVSGVTWEALVDGAGGTPYPAGSDADRMLQPSAGSGGGAAGWATGPYNSSYYRHTGGAGGGGGGFVDITCAGNINIYGLIDASGGRGGAGSLYYVNRPFTGGGGGGSGGGIRLLTPNAIDLSGGTLDARGGQGGLGASSTYPGASTPNNGGAGAMGRIVLEDGDSIITGLATSTVLPGEGSPGFYRGVFDATRFAGGGLRPVAISDLILVGPFDPEFIEPEQTYGGTEDFIAGIPGVASRGNGETSILIEARGFEMQRDGTPVDTPTVPWHTVGHFTDTGVEQTPAWHVAQPDLALLPADNAGLGIDALNGCEYIQLRVTLFLPDGFAALTGGPYLDDWLLRFRHNQ
ncbi:MAG: Ig-like domain-containing protein [Planctomycetota bacterium]|nr:Ig-like domain-containing protein [Planctomycetota bacterium]